MPGVIVASSVLCAAGRGAEQLWASVRAGISRIGSSHVMDRHFEPIQMGLVPEEALAFLAAKGIRFSVEGPATDERLAALRDISPAPVQ